MGKNQGPWSSGRTRYGLRFQSDLRTATGRKHNLCCFWPVTSGHSQFSVGSGELNAEVMMASVGPKGMAWGPGWSQSGACRLELPMCPKGEPKGDMDSPVWARPQRLKSAQPWARVGPQHKMVVVSASRTMGSVSTCSGNNLNTGQLRIAMS